MGEMEEAILMRTLIGVAVLSLVSGAAFGVSAVKKGDVNGDGRVDKADANWSCE